MSRPAESATERAINCEIPARPAVSAERVRGELQRILGSEVFRSRRPGQFLSFVVEITLAGDAGRIKEYLIAVELFGRPANYDPKDDPIVRIEAGRLRKKLAEYYAGPGQNDDIIIGLPKGGYVPDFQLRQPVGNPGLESSRKKRPRALLKSAAAVILLGAFALAAAYYFRTRLSASLPRSIAVLPFLDLNTSPAGEYLSDGVAEDLTTGLAQFNGLRVVAATSAFQFRGRPEDARKIGEQLNAGALLEGSISQSGNRLKINAQLIHTGSGYHLWSKTYDVQSQDLLASEQDIVQETARVLRLPAGGNKPAIKRDTENAEAHVLYLRGRYLWNTRQLADMRESVRLLQRATEDDPNYALAYAGLADSYTVMTINAQMPPAEAVPRARAALQRALEINPDLAQAHATMGLLKSQCEWDWRGAEQEFRRAIDLEPNYAPAHHWAALNYMELGQFADADAEFRQAQVLDPLSPMITEGLAENFYNARRYDETISTVRSMPNQKVGWVILAQAYIRTGMYQEALNMPEVIQPIDLNGWLLKAEARVASGDRPGGLKILEEMEGKSRHPEASKDYVPPGYMAWAYAAAGEKERAFQWLEKAYGQHDPALANLKVDPAFDSLRSDPRYLEMLRRVGFSN